MMGNRLTQRDFGKAGLIIHATNDVDARQEAHDKFLLAMEKLAAYEDSGFTPKEINFLVAERDAAVRDITCENICEACKHNGNGEACRERKHFAKAVMRTDCFEWRGVKGKEKREG